MESTISERVNKLTKAIREIYIKYSTDDYYYLIELCTTDEAKVLITQPSMLSFIYASQNSPVTND